MVERLKFKQGVSLAEDSRVAYLGNAERQVSSISLACSGECAISSLNPGHSATWWSGPFFCLKNNRLFSGRAQAGAAEAKGGKPVSHSGEGAGQMTAQGGKTRLPGEMHL